MMFPFVYRWLTVAVCLTCVSHAFGFPCDLICPGLFGDSDKTKCCRSEFGMPKCCSEVEYHMQSVSDSVGGILKDWQGNLASQDWHENTGFQDTRDWQIGTTSFDGDSKFPTILVIIAVAAIFGILVTCYVLCLCCPCCALYKRRKRGAVYRRVVTPTVTVPQANQPSAAVATNHPPEVNFAQPSTVGPGVVDSGYNQAPQPMHANFPPPSTMGYNEYNQAPQPQVAMQPPPPYSVAVASDLYPKQSPFNPMYQQ